ncbi:SH3 domain-containing protein [Nafulsella turpanensis]|uniref:SH3 domain-containing protein n=1 Tax=Nafulsella turpanensis TaxID=1265690 RepID=UPI0012688D76|nr:SH3 domain-containing protein [Nafulsella turpanensis]
MNLKTGPSTEYEVVKTLQGDTMQITLTETCKGNWCKVKVTEHKEHPCTGTASNKDNIVREYEGWIKLLDEKGMPNVWHYTKGC